MTIIVKIAATHMALTDINRLRGFAVGNGPFVMVKVRPWSLWLSS